MGLKGCVQAELELDAPTREALAALAGRPRFGLTDAKASERGANVPFEKRKWTNSRLASSQLSGMGAQARSGASSS